MSSSETYILTVPGAPGPDGGSFDLTSFSFGVSNGGGVSKLTDLHATFPDQAGVSALFDDSAKGTILPTVTVEVIQAGFGVTLTYTLQDAIISSITTSSHGPGSVPYESVTFSFPEYTVTQSGPPCYRRGTHIRTPTGETAVNELAIDDLVLTASGESRPVRWLGHRRIDCRRYPDPAQVWPIRICAGAFRDLTPSRDLWVSPGHGIFCEGVLVLAENLVNGVTVTQTPCDFVEYWHVELDSHDVLIADGMPAESYLDTGNRAAFANGSVHGEMFPDFKAKHWRDTCVPLIFEGPQLRPIRQMLLDRAQSLGFSITNCSEVHAIADGKRVEGVPLGEHRLAFMFGVAASHIQLRCRDFVPVHIDPASSDRRRLGLCVCRWQLDGVDLDLAGNESFAEGWHELEFDGQGRHMRWSRARVPLPTGTRLLVVELAGPGYYWDTTVGDQDARRNA